MPEKTFKEHLQRGFCMFVMLLFAGGMINSIAFTTDVFRLESGLWMNQAINVIPNTRIYQATWGATSMLVAAVSAQISQILYSLLTLIKGFLSLVAQPLSVAVAGWPRGAYFAIPVMAGTLALLAVPLVQIPKFAPRTCHQPETWPLIDGDNLFTVFTGNSTALEYAVDGCVHLNRVRDWSISLMYDPRLSV
jgi:hypothetical protein